MNKLLNVAALRESIKNITRILSEKSIEVTQRGSTAYVKADSTGKPIQVNVPFIPENASEELIDAINGFLDHEVGHLLFTNFDVVMQANKQGKAIAELHNIVEDTYIERKMSERFKGSASNLDNVGKFFLSKYTDARVQEAIETVDEQLAISALMVPAIRAWAGQEVFQDYMTEKWGLIESITDVINEDVRQSILDVACSEDALLAAQAIHLAITGLPPESEEESDSESKSNPSDSGKGGANKPHTDKDQEDQDNPANSEASEDEEEEGDLEDGEDSEDPKDDEGGESGSVELKPSKPSDPVMSTEDLDNALKGSDFDGVVADSISSDSKASICDSPYCIFTDEFDVIEPLELDRGYKERYLSEMEDRTKMMVGPLQKNLERLIVAKKQARWNAGRRRGRVNSSSLYRLKTGDDRVFRNREIEGETKDVAISLVCDNSGSMSGAPIEIAMIAAFAMSTVLDRINVAHEVSGFTTVFGDGYRGAEEESVKIGVSFSRYESLYLPIYKAFHERLGINQKKRLAYAQHKSFLRNNVDGESIAVAANRLLKRPEHGKIMFVLSDGEPAAYGNPRQLKKHLKETVLKYSKLGVKMIGIGICSNAVSSYYPDFVVLNDVEELPNQIMKELRKVMLG